MNPLEIMKNFISQGGNPEKLVMQAISNNNSNPMINNLIQMAKSGNSQGVEQFARNYFQERGKDFDKEFSDFMKNIKR